MFLFIPIALLFLSAGAILILQNLRKGFGFSWLIAFIVSFAVWAMFLLMRWFPPNPIPPFVWLITNGREWSLAFTHDLISWPYAFALASLLAATIFTSAVRQEERSGAWPWAGSLAIVGMGLLAVLAANPLTLLVAWTILDVLELGVNIINIKNRSSIQRSVISFSYKILGSLLMLGAMIVSRTNGVELSWTYILPQTGGFILAAAGLRLGVLPFHSLSNEDKNLARGIGTLLRMVSPASALVLLARVPASAIPQEGLNMIIFLTSMLLLFSVLMWVFSNDKFESRSYWIITMAGLSIAAALRGYPASSFAWGISLILVGGMFMLFSAKNQLLLIIPMLGCLGMLGFPFSPSASGWVGIVSPGFDLFSLVLVLVHFGLLAGLLRQLISDGEPFEDFENWVRLVYPFGLILLLISHWIIGIFGWPGSFTSGIWWVGWIAPIILLLYYFFFQRRVLSEQQRQRFDSWGGIISENLGKPLARFFKLSWLTKILLFLYEFLNRLIQFVSTIFEGEGGILWALLMLVLLITIISPGGLL